MTENGTARRGVADPYNALMTGFVETLVTGSLAAWLWCFHSDNLEGVGDVDVKEPATDDRG